MENVYVLWSGGLDSTYLIQNILEQRPEAHVYAGYVSVLNNLEKTQCELRAQKRMAPIFRKLFGERFHYLGTVMSMTIENRSNNMPLVQVPIWLSAVMCTGQDMYTEIAMGYVMNDCAISYIEEIKTVVKTFGQLTYPIDKEYPPVTFPLSKWGKDTIADNLKEELLPHIWTCEYPKTKRMVPCGDCDTCKRAPANVTRNKSVAKLKQIFLQATG